MASFWADGHGGTGDRHRLAHGPFARSMPGLDHDVAFGVGARHLGFTMISAEGPVIFEMDLRSAA